MWNTNNNTDHPGCRDAVIEGKTGLLVEARNKEVIVTALNKLLDNHEYSAEMGRQAHQYAKEKFDEKGYKTALFFIS